MPSATYDLFRTAMLGEKAVACVYDGHPRVVCPVILGRTNGEEKVLAFQVGGTSRSGLPPGGEWRCLTLAPRQCRAHQLRAMARRSAAHGAAALCRRRGRRR